MQSSAPTGTMQDPTAKDMMDAAKFAMLFLKANGGSVGREHHDGSEGNVVGGEQPKQTDLEKALALPPPVMVKADRPANTANGLAVPAQRAATPEPTAEEQRGSSNFAHAVHRTLQFEGGLNPSDTNGTPSKFGINQAANPDVYDSVKTPSDASQVYYNRYWKPLGADQMDPKLAHVAFDTAVISGVGKAKELIAQANGDPEKLLQLRKEFQDNLIAKNPEKYGKYEKDWNNRVDQLRTDIGNKLDLPQQQGLAVKAEEPTKEKKGGLGDFFTAENVVPILTGLAGMASSRSPYLGSAILEGLGAGANAYMGTQKSQAEINQAKAATSNIEAETNLQKNIIHGSRFDWMWVKPLQRQVVWAQLYLLLRLIMPNKISKITFLRRANRQALKKLMMFTGHQSTLMLKPLVMEACLLLNRQKRLQMWGKVRDWVLPDLAVVNALL